MKKKYILLKYMECFNVKFIRTDRFTECKNNGGYMERLPTLRQAPAEKYFHSPSFSKGNLR